MSRLTNKKITNLKENEILAISKEQYRELTMKAPNYKDVYKKLGKLEDIEDELYGVPLEFILTPASKGTKQVYWNNSYHDVRNIVPYEEHTCPYVEIFVRTNNKVNVKTLWFKDYKKTWWLSSDLEE